MKKYIVSDMYLPGHEAVVYGAVVEKELVLCRDCKHRMHNGTCIKNMKRKPDDGYCDEGERNEW